MRFIAGVLIVCGCVFGGYAALGGYLAVLWQPFEYVIILGAAVGAYVIGNSGSVLKQTVGALVAIIKGAKYKKNAYVELLGLQFSLFRLVQSKGVLGLEQHIEDPSNSAIFSRFPIFASNQHAVEFTCDYLRMLTMGANNVHELDALMEEELETHEQEQQRLVGAIQALADGTPALGIVAAVLGVIKTMGAISEPPEVLGHMIGGALVGTFFGVFVAYGFLGPMAQSLRGIFESESKYLLSLKTGLLAHVSGQAPVMAVEFARKSLLADVRPSFEEVERATQDLSNAA